MLTYTKALPKYNRQLYIIRWLHYTMVTTDSSELTRHPQVRPIKLAVRLVGSWRLCCCPSTVTELCFTLLQSYKSHSNFCSIGHCFISGSYGYEFTIIIFG